jgi:hypothetical protein
MVMVRSGAKTPDRTLPARARATSANAATPEALSLAPGSCTCPLKTNRSSGLVSPFTSATSVSSSEGKILVSISTLTRTGPFSSAASRASSARPDNNNPQPRASASSSMDENEMMSRFSPGRL